MSVRLRRLDELGSLLAFVATAFFAMPTGAQTFSSHNTECQNSDLDSRALLVAVRTYDNPAWGELEHVENDLRQLEKALYGHFDVGEPLMGPDMRTLRRRVTEFLECADNNDRLLLYYTGHGYSPERAQGFSSGRNEAYLTAKDTPPPHLASGYTRGTTGELYDDNSALPVSWLLDKARQSSAKDVLVVLDACQAASPLLGVDLMQQKGGFNQNNCTSFLRAMQVTQSMESSSDLARKYFEEAFTKLRAVNTRNVITSGFGSETVTAESGFVNAFLEGITSPLQSDGFSATGSMRVKDGRVDANELVQFIMSKLAQENYRQVPQLACATPNLFSF